MPASITQDTEWAGLAARYQAASSEQEREAILAETAQRERAVQARRQRKIEAMRFEDALQAQLEDATRVCRGHLVGAKGLAVNGGKGLPDERMLWRGPERIARQLASEELNAYWDANPRVCLSQYQQQERDGRRMQRDERDAQEISQGKENSMGIAGELRSAAGHVARDTGRVAGRATEIGVRQAIYDQRRRAVAASVAPGGGELATTGPAALVKQRVPVDGSETLTYVTRFLRHMIQFPSEAALLTTALWVMHSHCRDASGRLVFLTSPRLLFTSKVPGSGKSWAMEIAAQLCPSPAVMIEPTMPALVHSVGAAHDTVALDEVDVFFGGGQGERKAAARAIINAGYRGSGAYRRMYKGEAQIVPCFGALMMAGLGKIGTNTALEATLQRCHKVVMVKAAPGYRPPRWDRQAQYAAKIISDRLGIWASQNLDDLAHHVPDVPDWLNPREAELWEPLLSIADLIGEPWGQLARAACEEMIASGGQPPEDEDKLAELDDIMAGWDGLDDTISDDTSEEE